MGSLFIFWGAGCLINYYEPTFIISRFRPIISFNYRPKLIILNIKLIKTIYS